MQLNATHSTEIDPQTPDSAPLNDWKYHMKSSEHINCKAKHEQNASSPKPEGHVQLNLQQIPQGCLHASSNYLNPPAKHKPEKQPANTCD